MPVLANGLPADTKFNAEVSEQLEQESCLVPKLNADDFTIHDLKEPGSLPTELYPLKYSARSWKDSISKDTGHTVPSLMNGADSTSKTLAGHRDRMWLLDDIAALLRKEHNRFEARLGVHFSRQEKLLQQLVQSPAPVQPVTQGVPLAPYFPSSNSAVTSRPSRPERSARETPGIPETFALNPIYEEKVDTETAQSRVTLLEGDQNGAFNSPREEKYVEDEDGDPDTMDTDSGMPENQRSQGHQASQVFLREVKLGTTSTDRLRKEYKDQFLRLADWKERLMLARVCEVVNAYSRYLSDKSSEEIAQCILVFRPVDENKLVPGNHNLFLDLDSFLDLMLSTEIPPEFEHVVMFMQDAFDAEKNAHQDRLREVAAKRRRNRGAYDNISLTADVLGASVILLNGLMLGINSDVASDHFMWRITEYVFLVFFIAEFFFHMSRNGWRTHFTGRDWRWNVFDAILISCAVIDAALSEITANAIEGGPLQLISRTLRLARLSRLVRLLRFKVFAELKQLIFGVVAGIRVLSWAILLLIVFIYVVSLVIRQTIGADLQSEFASQFTNVPWTMFTVFRCLTDGCSAPDGTPLQVYLYYRYGTGFMIIYCIVFLFVSIGIFNLIMATFIDSVMAVSSTRKQIERANNAEKAKVKLTATVVNLWNSEQENVTTLKAKNLRRQSDRDLDDKNYWMQALKDVRVTRELLHVWMCQPDMMNLLDELDISVADHSLLFDALDCDLSGEVEGHELVTGLMALRGPTEKIDVITTLVAVKYMIAMLIKIEANVCPHDTDNTAVRLAQSTRVSNVLGTALGGGRRDPNAQSMMFD